MFGIKLNYKLELVLDLDKVEKEDEEIVESVQKGVNSDFTIEEDFHHLWRLEVHHFHSLLSKFIKIIINFGL